MAYFSGSDGQNVLHLLTRFYRRSHQYLFHVNQPSLSSSYKESHKYVRHWMPMMVGSVSVSGRLSINFRFAVIKEGEAGILGDRFDTTTTRYKIELVPDNK